MQNNWQQSEYIKAYRFAAQAHQGQTVTGTDQLGAAALLLDERKDGLVSRRGDKDTHRASQRQCIFRRKASGQDSRI